MNPRLWNVYDAAGKAHFRSGNMIGRATVRMVDDTGPAQLYQFEGYGGELREQMQRLGTFGIRSVPLPGAALVTCHQGGQRGFATALGVEDGRYAVTGGSPGENVFYMVDGASKSDGSGGTVWRILQGLMGGICKLMGKTMVIGDSAKTTTIDVYGKTSVTLHTPLCIVTNGGSPHWVSTEGGLSTVLKADA